MSSSPASTPAHLRITPSAGDAAAASANPVQFAFRFSLGCSIKPKLQECICQGLYIPFEIILTSEQGGSVDQNLKTVAPASDSCSQLSGLPLFLEWWTNCFLIFVAIQIEEKPQDAPQLLQYAHVICSIVENTPDPSWSLHGCEF